MSLRTAVGGIAVAAVLVTPVVIAPTAQAAVPAKYKNCTALHKYYKHGVGKAGAKDKTSGTPVTNFKRSTSIYQAAIKANRGLDRDKDGIACEKR